MRQLVRRLLDFGWPVPLGLMVACLLGFAAAFVTPSVVGVPLFFLCLAGFGASLWWFMDETY